MGFFSRLIQETSKQVNGAIEELEKKSAAQQTNQIYNPGGYPNPPPPVASYPYNYPNYHNYVAGYTNYPPSNSSHTNHNSQGEESYPPSSSSNIHNHNYGGYPNPNPASYGAGYTNYSSTGPSIDQIYQEQHLQSLQNQLAMNQIRRAEESMTVLGTIGTNDRVEWVRNPASRGYSSGFGSGGLGSVG